MLLVTDTLKLLFTELQAYGCRLNSSKEALCPCDYGHQSQWCRKLYETCTRDLDSHARTASSSFSLSLSLPFIMFAQAHIIPCISILLWYLHKHSHAQWKVTEVGLSWSAWAQISFRGFMEQSQTEPLRKTLQSTDVHELLSIRFLSLSFILFYILIVVTWTYTFFKSK